MSLMKIDPRSADRPYLPAEGWYGGGKNGTEVTMSLFENPAEERTPGWDRECDDGPYAYFGFQVRGDDLNGVVFIDHWEQTAAGTGSRAIPFLTGAGVTVVEGEFDPDSVVPRNVMIRVLAPRQDKSGRWRTGRVVEVKAV